MSRPPEQTEYYLPRTDLQRLIDVLKEDGYDVIGPTVDQGAIVFSEIQSVEDLPRGWTEEQSPGVYRLKKRDDDALFGFNVGPHSWKRYLFPPLTTLAAADRNASGWEMHAPQDEPPRYAFLGVRACEIAAIGIQDRTFLGGPYIDPVYQARRERALILAVNCTQAAATCFCTSMNSGPRCNSGFDLALTELPGGFLVEVGSDAGRGILDRLPVRAAEERESNDAADRRQCAVDQIKRTMDTTDLRGLLLGNFDHPRWADVAERCLSCTNCTMVCPTCFCHSVHDVSDLSGDHVRRERQWDSCFNIDFSFMNGSPVRNDIRSRYRQWLTHKLASWIDQFGTSGCVGCGRCITWCPVGIDLTEEVAAIRQTVPAANRSLAASPANPAVCKDS